jgi:hypothetical protein
VSQNNEPHILQFVLYLQHVNCMKLRNQARSCSSKSVNVDVKKSVSLTPNTIIIILLLLLIIQTANGILPVEVLLQEDTTHKYTYHTK